MLPPHLRVFSVADGGKFSGPAVWLPQPGESQEGVAAGRLMVNTPDATALVVYPLAVAIASRVVVEEMMIGVE